MQSLILLIVYLVALLALAWQMGLYLAKEHGNALRCTSVVNIVPGPLILDNI
jgi:hypothetical protein